MGSSYFDDWPPVFSSDEFKYDLTARTQTSAEDHYYFASKFSCGSILNFYAFITASK